MNNLNKLKSLVSIALSIIIMLTSLVLNAASLAPSSPSADEHKEIINQFISEIEAMQNQSLNVAQSAIKGSVHNNTQLQQQIDSINNVLQALNERIEDYADIVQGLNEQDRQVRLTFNFLNLVRSNLYTLTSLARTTNTTERLRLLDEFFRTRISAVNTLTILEDLLEKYNS